MSTKMNRKRSGMVVGLSLMAVVSMNVLAENGGKAKAPADPFVKGAKPPLARSASDSEAMTDNLRDDASDILEQRKQEGQRQEEDCNLELDASVVFFPGSFIDTLVMVPGSLSEEKLIKAWREGKGRLVASHRMVGRQNTEMCTRGVLEYVYPTEFKVITAGGKTGDTGANVKTNGAAGDRAGTYWAVEPREFETRGLGFNSQAVLDHDAAMTNKVVLTMLLSYDAFKSNQVVGTVESVPDGLLTRMIQPEMYAISAQIDARCTYGHTLVQGGSLSSDGKDRGFFFLTPRRVPVTTRKIDGQQIETQQLLVYFPRALIEQMAREADSAAPSEDQILNAWNAGKGRLVFSYLGTSRYGVESIVKSGMAEDCHPTAFSVRGSVLRNGEVGWCIQPRDFEVREIGLTTTYVSERTAAGTISMVMKFQSVSRCADQEIDVARLPGTTYQIWYPQFYSQEAPFSGFVQPNKTVVFGGMLSAEGDEMGYYLVTPRIKKEQE